MSRSRPQVRLTARGGASGRSQGKFCRGAAIIPGPLRRPPAAAESPANSTLGPADHPPFELPDAIVDSLLKQFAQSSQLGANAGYIEDLYEQYLVDPDSVVGEMEGLFRRLQGPRSRRRPAFGGDPRHRGRRPARRARRRGAAAATSATTASAPSASWSPPTARAATWPPTSIRSAWRPSPTRRT